MTFCWVASTPCFQPLLWSIFSTEAVIGFMHTVNPYSEKHVPYSANPYEQCRSDHGLKILVPYEEAVTGTEYEFLKLWFLFPLCSSRSTAYLF